MSEMDTEAERIEDFKGSLKDLKENSKPYITMLTQLAESEKDIQSAASGIVRVIEERLREVGTGKRLSPVEMPVLYLIDSIVKNVGEIYIKLFTQNIVSNFCRIFERSDEKVRSSLYKLRCTWKGFFPAAKLEALDRKIREKFDPKWPIQTASHSTNSENKNKTEVTTSRQVHINPNFIKKGASLPAVNAAENPKHMLAKIAKEKQEALKRAAQAEKEAQLLKQKLEMQQKREAEAKMQIQEALQQRIREEERNRRKEPGSRKRNKNRNRQSPGPSASRRSRQSTSPPPSQMQSVMPPVSGPLYTRRSEALNSNGYNGPVWASGPEMRSSGYDEDYRVAPSMGHQTQVTPSIVEQISHPMVPPVTGTSPIKPAETVINELVSRLLNNNNKSALVAPVPDSGPSVVVAALEPPVTITPNLISNSNNTISSLPAFVTPTNVLNPNIAAGSTTPWLDAPKQASPPRAGVTGSKKQKAKKNSEDKPEPPLSWNKLESLKVARPSLIAAIYDGRQCTSCPLRFENSKSKEYTAHLDWHFRQNKKKKGRGPSGPVTRRAWFYPFHLWLLFKEVSDEDDTAGESNVDGDQSNPNSNDAVDGGQDTTVKAAEDDLSPLNSCMVCGDRFEIFFDQDQEAWLLRNAVETPTGNCHPMCRTDMSVAKVDE